MSSHVTQEVHPNAGIIEYVTALEETVLSWISMHSMWAGGASRWLSLIQYRGMPTMERKGYNGT